MLIKSHKPGDLVYLGYGSVSSGMNPDTCRYLLVEVKSTITGYLTIQDYESFLFYENGLHVQSLKEKHGKWVPVSDSIFELYERTKELDALVHRKDLIFKMWEENRWNEFSNEALEKLYAIIAAEGIRLELEEIEQRYAEENL